MSQSEKSGGSTASSHTKLLLSENGYYFVMKSMLPFILTKALELFVLYNSINLQFRNIAQFSLTDSLLYFCMYTIYGVSLPAAVQVAFEFKYSLACVDDDRERMKYQLENLQIIILILVVVVLAIGYPTMMVYVEKCSASSRIMPSLYYFSFGQFALSSYSVTLTAQYYVEGRYLLALSSRALLYGVWGFLETTMYSYLAVEGRLSNNLLSALAIGFSHLVVCMWLGFWNLGKSCLNAFNATETKVNAKEIFKRNPAYKRGRDLVVQFAEVLFLFISYFSMAFMILLLLGKISSFQTGQQLMLTLVQCYIFGEIYKIAPLSLEHIVVVTTTICMHRKKYKRLQQLTLISLFLAFLMSAIVFILEKFTGFTRYLLLQNHEYQDFIGTPDYNYAMVFEFVINSLSIFTECSEIFLLLNDEYLSLFIIVALKIVIMALEVSEMSYYFGEKWNLMLLIGICEGCALVCHFGECLAKEVEFAIKGKKEGKKDKKHKK